MQWIHQSLIYLHILFGSMSLLLFWIPTLTKKGGLDHIKFGHYYAKVMYAVAGSGALMSLMVMTMPTVIKPEYFEGDVNVEGTIARIQLFWGYLLHLSLIIFISVRHGLAVLSTTQIQNLRRWHYRLPLVLCVMSGIFYLSIGLANQQVLFIVFGVLGIMIAVGMLRYTAKSLNTKADQIKEHLGAMIGSGIGSHTAFFAFGARSLLADFGYWQLVVWVLPGVVGAVSIYVMSKRYSSQSESENLR